MLGVAPKHIAYLLRADEGPLSPDEPLLIPPDLRANLWVRAVGVEEANDLQRDAPIDPFDDDHGEPRQPRPQRADLLAGLHGLLVPIAFGIHGDETEVRLDIGTWSGQAAHAGARLAARLDIIDSVLTGMYPSVEVERDPAAEPAGLDVAGLVLGVPSPSPAATGDRATPIDRVIRAMRGCRWAVTILAYPLDDIAVARAQTNLLNSARQAEAAARAEGGPNPMSQQYVELCKEGMRSLTEARASGGWQAGVYLLGDSISYPRLAAVWRSVFAGQATKLEPVRVFHHASALRWATGWAMPQAPVPPGPDGYRRPFECQTLLSSSELGRYVRLPRCETVGFAVHPEPVFDIEPPRRAQDRPLVTLGHVTRNGHQLAPTYAVPVNDLTRHTFVCGVTGAGKTNTIFGMLDSAHAAGVPFLVLEPAKAEYRGLLRHPRFGEELQIFTLSDETVSPLRCNPFEVESGISVQLHLDLLRSLFVASFGMWDPLPQVLERCLFEIYADRGWDIADDYNPRLGLQPTETERTAAFPTLSDLVDKAEEVIAELGYEDKITDNLRAALVTRVNALRIGGKGAMLDSTRSTPAEQLFTQPTVVELERLGDDDDKAFLMGLMLIRLAEYRRARGEQDTLRHLLVIEEAHRLLASTSPKSTELGGDPKAKAVTAFTNLLAEVRSYGLGVVIADQVPVKLAPEVIKNTNLKIVHRLLAEDDRKAVGGTMAMRPSQLTALATLEQGIAATFSEGDDGPILVRPLLAKDGRRTPTDDDVITHMAGRIELSGCPAGCPPLSAECRAAAALVEDALVIRTADRVCTTLLAQPDSASTLVPDIHTAARPYLTRRPHLLDAAVWPCLLARIAQRYTARRGAAAGWSYTITARLAGELQTALRGEPNDLASVVADVFARGADPYPRCALICGPSLCLYRFDAARRAAELANRFRDARQLAAPTRLDELFELGMDGGNQIIYFPPDERADRLAGRRASLCVTQHALVNAPELPLPNAIALLDDIYKIAESLASDPAHTDKGDDQWTDTTPTDPR